MPAGRPTKYDPKYCDDVVEFCKDGYSLTAFAGEIGVARQTISEWAETHAEFSVAVSRAKAVCCRWWENKLRDRADGDGSSTAAMFGVKNMGRDDWQERQTHEHTGKDGGPIKLWGTHQSE